MKIFITTVALAFLLLAGSVVDSVDVGESGWLNLNVNLNEANARGRGGRGGGHRGGGGPRRSARTSSRRVNSPGRHRDVDVDVDIDVDRHRHHHVGAAIAGALVVGSIIYSLPPACTTVFADGITYKYCDGVYYEPSYRGAEVVYVVVDNPT